MATAFCLSTGTMQIILAILILAFAFLVAYILILDTSDPRTSRSLRRDKGIKWHTRGVSIMSTISERSEGRSRRASRRGSFVSEILSSAAVPERGGGNVLGYEIEGGRVELVK
ncbi:hypothetical protein P280DRAFT_142423 [Massarina eburnea CBS 473.64]|uniref:Uncharacterized protein n=1 Tax=Massarina eburnea CBS 473.64 TaxID=1395130 RepID=A0A6A6RNA4_9PLEO|nr:hypothetical protein P280DRAFT_142423 [Massarina eburnea CBS 473.64]